LTAVRTQQVGRLAVEIREIAAAAHVMSEAQAAVALRLGTRSLKDLIAAEPQQPV
jgi:RecB family endonuclease NucS